MRPIEKERVNMLVLSGIFFAVALGCAGLAMLLIFRNEQHWADAIADSVLTIALIFVGAVCTALALICLSAHFLGLMWTAIFCMIMVGIVLIVIDRVIK